MLKNRPDKEKNIYCTGLYLSARWFVLSANASEGVNIVILPDKEGAEYCTADLYQLTEGDCVFLLPPSGKGIEKSNYKSSVSVQRTAAISEILKNKGEKIFIICSPESLEERIQTETENPFFTISKGQEISFDIILSSLAEMGFERCDFVSAPGQYAVRGSLVDVFSYAGNEPYRISFWGNEVENISIFDCNTQISKGERESADIIGSYLCETTEKGKNLLEIIPENSTLWMDSSDLYKEKEFFSLTERFHRVFLQIPLGIKADDPEKFHINPQPRFNKNFDLLEEDIRRKTEKGYKVYIYGEKASQLNRIRSIISSEGGILPQFVEGKNIHEGFIDEDNKIAYYTDHEIFDRFHRVSIRRSVEKSEQLTINDLNSFNIGDYVVHENYGIGVFMGIEQRIVENVAKDYIKIGYADESYLYITPNRLDYLQKYIGGSENGQEPKLSKMGGSSWAKAKAKAKKADKSYELPEDTVYPELYTEAALYDAGNLKYHDGSWNVGTNNTRFPAGFVYQKDTGNEALKFTVTGKTLFLVYKVSNSTDYGMAGVYINCSLAGIANGYGVNGWGGPIPTLIEHFDETTEMEVEIRMLDDHVDKSFEIFAIGVSAG